MGWNNAGGWSGQGWGRAAAASYSGLGDVASGATGYWGLRAYNTAYATGTNPCINIRDSGGTNTATINITTSGFADWTAIAAFVSAHGTASVTQIYDQIGTNHLTQATFANMPTLSSTLSGKYALSCVGSAPQYLSRAPGPIIGSQPLSFSFFFNSNTPPAGTHGLVGDTNTATVDVKITGQTINAAGGTGISCVNDGATWHAGNIVWNGASSNFNLDGTDNIFTSSGTLSGATMGREWGDSLGLDGLITEFCVWASAVSSPSSLSSNQHTAWGA